MCRKVETASRSNILIDLNPKINKYQLLLHLKLFSENKTGVSKSTNNCSRYFLVSVDPNVNHANFIRNFGCLQFDMMT